MSNILDKVRQRLNSMSKGKSNNDIWKPEPGEHKIRLVPSAYNPDNWPFSEFKIYYGFNGKHLLSPASEAIGKPQDDPILAFIKQLYATKDPEKAELAKDLSAKDRIFAPVIVRGEEKLGVRLYGMSKKVYKEILAICNNEEFGDISDINDGVDLRITVQTPAEAGNKYGDTKVLAMRKSSALSDNSEEVKKWTITQPNPLSLFELKSFEELRAELETYLNSGSDEEPKSKVVSKKATDESEEDDDDVQIPKAGKPVKAASSEEDVSKTIDNLFEKRKKG